MSTAWQFEYRPSADLPALAWVARVTVPRVVVACGTAVRRTEDAFFDGTWVGPPALASVLDSTTPFGAGMVIRDGELFVVPAGHTCEGVYVVRRGAADEPLLVSNSLAAVLVASGASLLPGADYVSRMIRLAEGLDHTPIVLPTSGRPVEFHFFENLRLSADGDVAVSRKPREAPFATYDHYLGRLEQAFVSLRDNASDYSPAVALSNGYDSTAMAVVAARNGTKRAITFASVRPARTDGSDTSDSGAGTAGRLGMGLEVVDRLAYLSRSDLPEAEFLATGGPGEDVSSSAMEDPLRKSIFVTGDVGAALWRYGRPKRSDLWRLDLSGSSLTEFRLRVDFHFVPLPVFGMTEIPSLQQITLSDEMKPWSVPGYYNRPIARRIAEQAGGLPRGSFATVKHAATALIHQDPERHLAPASLDSIREFAAAEGTSLQLVARRPLRRRERFVIKAAGKLHVDRIGRDLAARQWAMIHHEPRQGSLLLRWAVATVSGRYAAVPDLLGGVVSGPDQGVVEDAEARRLGGAQGITPRPDTA